MRNNFVSFVGRIGKCEEKSIQSGYLYVMSIVYNNSKRSQDGTWTNTPMWFPVRLFARTQKDLRKGDLVVVTGSLTEHQFNGKSYIGILADSVLKLEKTARAKANTDPAEEKHDGEYCDEGQDDGDNPEIPF